MISAPGISIRYNNPDLVPTIAYRFLGRKIEQVQYCDGKVLKHYMEYVSQILIES